MFMPLTVNPVSATAIPEAATTTSQWIPFHLSTTEEVEEFVMTVSITPQVQPKNAVVNESTGTGTRVS